MVISSSSSSVDDTAPAAAQQARWVRARILHVRLSGEFITAGRAKMSLSRRKFTGLLGGTAAAALLTGRPVKAADSAHTITVRMDWLPSGYQTPFFLAQEKGWYQKAGLDVKIDQGNGSATTVQLVGAGQYDAGLAY